MMNEENAVKTAATVIDGVEQMHMELGPKAPLTVHYTPPPGTIARVLMVGQKNALTAKKISNITGLPLRMVTKMILQERRQGAPIMSSPDCGYWIAEDASEVVRCSSALFRRAKTQLATAAALKRLVR